MLTLNNIDVSQPCGCGSGKSYEACCYPFHLEKSFPITAEQLMRSRFVAFQLQLADYLLKTWAEETHPENIDFTDGIQWKSLSINGRKKGRKKDLEGWVTFVASYELNGEQGTLHEKSYFNKDSDGRWLYVEGEIKN